MCACWQCHVLIGSMGVICGVGGEHGERGPRKDNQSRTQKDEYTCTYRYLDPHDPWYCMRERESTAQRSTAQHRATRQGTSPHGTARRCAKYAVLHCLAGSAFFVIQQYSTHKPGGPVTGIILRMMPGIYERVSTAQHAARHNTPQHRTLLHCMT